MIASPGHSEDGLVLADEENRLLFTGDTVYPGPLYAHRADSGPDRYRDTILRLAAMFSDYTLCCSIMLLYGKEEHWQKSERPLKR